MHLHIIGIGGTFMSAIAILAREAGYQVTGCDANVYSPIKELLQDKGISWIEGYEETALALKADKVIIGNAAKRGMPVVEAILNHNKNYSSGPQWLADTVLSRYKVLAIAGTHGKTTTTSLAAFILAKMALSPAFLVGGIIPHFNTNACFGSGEWFVIEADEYDSAFFDKRPKFMHYRPHIAVLNNLEFDHADIYPNLEAIEQQFHYYIKTIPGEGILLKPKGDVALNRVIDKGIYSRIEDFSLVENAAWRAELVQDDGSAFKVFYQNKQVGEVHWPLIGKFNVENALAAIAATVYVGADPQKATATLAHFTPPKRRLEVKAVMHHITVYDDFAHHPTAVNKTIQALKESKRHQRIVVIIEFASYTMRAGLHNEFSTIFAGADLVIVLAPPAFDIEPMVSWPCPYWIFKDTASIVLQAAKEISPGDAIVTMSNRGFNNIHQELIQAIGKKFECISIK